MKLKCTQENLSKALSFVNKAVSAKASLPILGNILFTAKDGIFSLASSNLETSILVNLNASIEKEGSVAVPARLFNEFIVSLPAGNLDITTDGNALKIAGGGSSAKFNCMSADDFPATPSAKKGLGVNLSGRDFSSAVLSCSFCAAIGDSRPALTGVFLKKEGKNLTVVATDGFRLSESSVSLLDDSGKETFSLLVPAKTLAEVARMFASSEDAVKLTYSELDNLAVFECGQTNVAIRILDGEFPDYKRIIPASYVLEAHSKTADLVQAVKIAGVFAKDAKEGNNLLKISFDPSGDCLVYSTAAQSGEGSTTIKMEVDSKDKLVLAFNSKYLLDFFNNVKPEDIIVYSGGESSPCLFKSPNTPNFLHLIMPVKLNG